MKEEPSMRHPPQACHSKSEGILLPRIQSRCRQVLPPLCADLCFDGLPCTPLRLHSLCASGVLPHCRPLNTPSQLQLSIPVCAQLCDACGKVYHALSTVETQLCLPAWMDPCAGTAFIVPCVQLMHAECCGEGRFRVELRITVEIYLLRFEPCLTAPPRPACPSLPLYPPPLR